MGLQAGCLFILVALTCAGADDIDFAVSNSILIKALREMTNQTQPDTLNLPANASSIRENITDTFSCDNQTYGYYADMDNDCQVFHVCVPTQTPGGRNITYRYSFICPKETVFNQAVLTCTRPIDSIPCEESETLYHLNAEIGKEENKTQTAENEKKDNRKIHKRKETKRKENIVMENFIKDIVKDELKEKLEELEFGIQNTEEDSRPMLLEAVVENVEVDSSQEEKDAEDLERIVMERHLRNERQMRRGGFRFKSDV